MVSLLRKDCIFLISFLKPTLYPTTTTAKPCHKDMNYNLVCYIQTWLPNIEISRKKLYGVTFLFKMTCQVYMSNHTILIRFNFCMFSVSFTACQKNKTESCSSKFYVVNMWHVLGLHISVFSNNEKDGLNFKIILLLFPSLTKE